MGENWDFIFFKRTLCIIFCSICVIPTKYIERIQVIIDVIMIIIKRKSPGDNKNDSVIGMRKDRTVTLEIKEITFLK